MSCKINMPVRKGVSKVNNKNSSKKAENLFKASNGDNNEVCWIRYSAFIGNLERN